MIVGFQDSDTRQHIDVVWRCPAQMMTTTLDFQTRVPLIIELFLLKRYRRQDNLWLSMLEAQTFFPMDSME
jgi:hypothetical protein